MLYKIELKVIPVLTKSLLLSFQGTRDKLKHKTVLSLYGRDGQRDKLVVCT